MVATTLFKSKSQPDENKDGTKEKIIGLTTKELADYYKKITGKAISVDNLRKKIITELINNDYLGEIKSELDRREFIYYPLMEFDNTQNEIILNEDIIIFKMLSYKEEHGQTSKEGKRDITEGESDE